MIREFNQQWDKDYVRKTTETLQTQDDRRKSASEKGLGFSLVLSFMNNLYAKTSGRTWRIGGSPI
jgi:hypothetical protein